MKFREHGDYYKRYTQPEDNEEPKQKPTAALHFSHSHFDNESEETAAAAAAALNEFCLSELNNTR